MNQQLKTIMIGKSFVRFLLLKNSAGGDSTKIPHQCINPKNYLSKKQTEPMKLIISHTKTKSKSINNKIKPFQRHNTVLHFEDSRNKTM